MSFIKSIISAVVSIFKPSTVHSENKAHIWKPEWTETLKTLFKQHLDELNKASDIEKLYPSYLQLKREEQIAVWCEFFKTIAWYESGYDTNCQFVDVGTKGNKNTWSIGLMQMSVVDQSNLGIRLGLDFNALLDPRNNLKLAVLVMVNQVQKRGKVIIPYAEKGNPKVYWATINPGNKFDKTDLILPVVHALSFKKNESVFTPWMGIANEEMGISEISGSKHNPRIVEYHQSTILKAKDDETAWCSSFVTWVLERAGYKSTKSAWARSYLNYGNKVLPEYGCICVFSRGTNSGHVGFYIKSEGDYIYVLGGNQNNQVNISKYPKSRLLGYRWPVKV